MGVQSLKVDWKVGGGASFVSGLELESGDKLCKWTVNGKWGQSFKTYKQKRGLLSSNIFFYLLTIIGFHAKSSTFSPFLSKKGHKFL